MIKITYKTVVLLWVFGFVSLRAQTITIYKAAKIYVCDTGFSTASAMAVEGNKILMTGTEDSVARKYPGATVVNYGNRIIVPGFTDAHCHFYGTAKGFSECNLLGTKSSKACIKQLKKFAKSHKTGWLTGRGWDQNDWPGQAYPTLEELDKAFPARPVFLKRIDGHAAWINTAALRAAGVDPARPVTGGEFLMVNGKFSGIVIDNAVDLIAFKVPDIPRSEKIANLQVLEKKCFSFGLTTVDDAGLSVRDMYFLDTLQQKNQLQMRTFVMLNSEPATYEWIASNGIYLTDRMRVSAVKFYLDGALGSRGALMKKPYSDRRDHTGLLLTPLQEFGSYSHYLYTSGYQACVHAIGDSANAIALRTFRLIMPPDMDLRWRIEHAQITDPKDFKLYKNRSIIPSIQPTHATSDAPWAQSRIGQDRMQGAYAYASLRKAAGVVALGTDFPVEDISTFKTFYSAVTRLDAAGVLKTPFRPEEALSRREALLGMTLWAAWSNLEDGYKGSLESGKLADFVVLNQDLVLVQDKKIMKTKVVATYLDGKRVFGK